MKLQWSIAGQSNVHPHYPIAQRDLRWPDRLCKTGPGRDPRPINPRHLTCKTGRYVHLTGTRNVSMHRLAGQKTQSARMAITALLIGLIMAPVALLNPRPAAAAGTYYVATTGSDSTGTGTASEPWKTIQKAADSVGPGATVLIEPGTYHDAVYISIAATSTTPVVFRGDGAGVVIEASGVDRDAVYIEASSYVAWQNIRVQDAPRAGLRVSVSNHVTIADNVFANNQRWGLFTDFSDDLLIEGNESFGATIEHGIYVSNSGDRPTIRGKVIHDNHANGLHMNGDESQG